MSAPEQSGGPGVEGPPRPFFRSRWVTEPEHVRELDAGAGLPAGFRAAGVRSGIKPSGNPDLGLLVCDSEGAVSAARFTSSGTAAAPVLVCQERLGQDGDAVAGGGGR